MRVETKILENLLYNEDYCRKVVPHLKLEYFSERIDKAICKVIIQFFMDYNKLPDASIVKLELDKSDLTDKELHDAYTNVDEFKNETNPIEYKLQITEKFCKDKSLYNAILQSISIIEGKDKTYSQEMMPKLLQDA
jgi:replicative DNA helicase